MEQVIIVAQQNVEVTVVADDLIVDLPSNLLSNIGGGVVTIPL